MPQKFGNLPPNWDDIDDECQHIPMNCPWANTSENETQTAVTTCLKWTFKYDFWISVTAHPEGNPCFSELLVPLSETLDDYEDFPEPHLNSYLLYTLGKLLDYLFRRYNPHNGQWSSCLSWSSHRQVFWYRSRSGPRIFYPTNRTKNQLCSWRRTCRCWWTG